MCIWVTKAISELTIKATATKENLPRIFAFRELLDVLSLKIKPVIRREKKFSHGERRQKASVTQRKTERLQIGMILSNRVRIKQVAEEYNT